jgi:hypothetical protein
VTEARNYPLILVALGFVAVFIAVAAESPWPAVAGAILVLVGGVWGGTRLADPTPDTSIRSADVGVAGSDPSADREPAGRAAEVTGGHDPA